MEAAEAKAAEDAALRGHLFRLREYLGLLPGGTEREIRAELRAKLKAIGVRAGRFALYLPEMLKPRPMALRAQLWALSAKQRGAAIAGRRAGLHHAAARTGRRGFAETMGWVPAGPAAGAPRRGRAGRGRTRPPDPARPSRAADGRGEPPRAEGRRAGRSLCPRSASG